MDLISLLVGILVLLIVGYILYLVINFIATKFGFGEPLRTIILLIVGLILLLAFLGLLGVRVPGIRV